MNTAASNINPLNPPPKSRRRYTPADKKRLVEQWQRSRLSKAAFCQQEKLSAGYFYSWTTPTKLKQMFGEQRVRLSPVKILPDPAKWQGWTG